MGNRGLLTILNRDDASTLDAGVVAVVCFLLFVCGPHGFSPEHRPASPELARRHCVVPL
jgi:hypothetical protein